MTVEVVLFDLDDTVFAHSKAVAHGMLGHRTALALPGDEATELERWTALEEHHYHRYLRHELGFYEMRRARARGFVEPLGIELSDDDADAWFASYIEHYRASWQLYSDTVPTLDSLHQRLGIITNAERAFQLGKIEKLGIADRFEHVIASGDVGHAKPDARIFLAAVQAFDVDARHAAYVGDRLQTDAIGAANAGLLGIWLDRHRAATPDELAAAANAGVNVIHSLNQLAALL